MAKATAPKVAKKTELTRARAEKLIAQTTVPEELKDDRFMKHPNKHVVKKAQTRLARFT